MAYKTQMFNLLIGPKPNKVYAPHKGGLGYFNSLGQIRKCMSIKAYTNPLNGALSPNKEAITKHKTKKEKFQSTPNQGYGWIPH